jgi:hypothetical protein
MVTLLHEQDGQVDVYETWDLTDIAVANVRFDELARPKTLPLAPLPASVGPSNDADRWLRANPSIVLEEGEALGRTLAVRSDNSAMHELSIGEILVTSWTSAGEPRFTVRYSRDEFNYAMWELQEMGLAYGGFAPASRRRAILERWGIALQEENWSAARAALADDYVAESHQFLEAGAKDLSRDQLINMIKNLKGPTGAEVRLILSEIHADSDMGWVVSEDFVTIDAEGWDVSRGGVSMILIGDDVIVSAEGWDDTDLEAATRPIRRYPR